MTSLFADTALAQRIEQAECELSMAIARGVQGRDGAEGLICPVAGGAAVFVRPGSPMNKLIGAGFEGPADAASLAAIEAVFRERAAPLQAEVSTLADPAVVADFSRRGYLLTGFENVLGMRLDSGQPAPEAGPSSIVVREVEPGGEKAWGAVAVEGFSHPDSTDAQAPQEAVAGNDLARVVADMLHDRSFRHFLAWYDGRLAGAASLRVSGSLAGLAGATTLPPFRRRGVQSALLETRLRLAREAGCELATVTTAPGSKSQENAMRRGFSLLYSRALLVKEPMHATNAHECA